MHALRRWTPSAEVLALLARQCAALPPTSRRWASTALQPRSEPPLPLFPRLEASTSTNILPALATSFEESVRARKVDEALDVLQRLPVESWNSLPTAALSSLLLICASIKALDRRRLAHLAQQWPLFLHYAPDPSLTHAAALMFVLQDDYRAAAALTPRKSLHHFIDSMVIELVQHSTKQYTNWNLLLFRLSKIQDFLRSCQPAGAFDWTPELFHCYVRGNLESLHWQDLRLFLVQEPHPLDICESFKANSAEGPLEATFDLLIGSYLSSYNLAMARRTLQLRFAAGHEPSQAMYLAMVRGYRSLGGHQDIFDKVLTDDEGLALRYNPEVLNALLETHILDGEVKQAWKLFTERFNLDGPPSSAFASHLIPRPAVSRKPRPSTSTFALMIRLLSIHRDHTTRALKFELWNIIRRQPTPVKIDDTLAEAIIEQAITKNDLPRARRLYDWFENREGDSPWPLECGPIRRFRSSISAEMLKATLRMEGLHAALEELELMRSRGANIDYRFLRTFVQHFASNRSYQAAQWIRRMIAKYPGARRALAQLNHWVCNSWQYRREEFQPVWVYMARMTKDAPRDWPAPAMSPYTQDPSCPSAVDFGAPRSAKAVATLMHGIAATRIQASTPDLLWTILRDSVINVGLKPTSDHLNAIVISCYHLGNLDKAVEALEIGHKKLRVTRSPAAFTTVILMHLKQRLFRKADQLYTWMRSLHITADNRLERVMAYSASMQGKVEEATHYLTKTLGDPATPLSERAIATTILYTSALERTYATGDFSHTRQMQKQLLRLLRRVDPSAVAEVADHVLRGQLKRTKQIYRRGYLRNKDDALAQEGFEDLTATIELSAQGKAVHDRDYERLEDLVERELFLFQTGSPLSPTAHQRTATPP